METFAMVPADTRYMWLLPVVVSVILIGVTALLIGTVAGSGNASFEVSPDGLRLRGDWYGRLIPASQIRAQDAKRVDFAAEPGLTTKWRMMGTAMPGYNAGWFKLRNGEKALLYLTDRKRAVYVPTTAGYGVLLSPENPDAFLAALRAVAK